MQREQRLPAPFEHGQERRAARGLWRWARRRATRTSEPSQSTATCRAGCSRFCLCPVRPRALAAGDGFTRDTVSIMRKGLCVHTPNLHFAQGEGAAVSDLEAFLSTGFSPPLSNDERVWILQRWPSRDVTSDGRVVYFSGLAPQSSETLSAGISGQYQ